MTIAQQLALTAHRLAETIRSGTLSDDERAQHFDTLEYVVDSLVELVPPAPPPALVMFTRGRAGLEGNGARYQGQQ